MERTIDPDDFINNYSEEKRSSIKFKWNGLKEAEFSDENLSFRYSIINFIKNVGIAAPSVLLRDLFAEESDYYLETGKNGWWITSEESLNNLSYLCSRLLIQSKTDYIDDLESVRFYDIKFDIPDGTRHKIAEEITAKIKKTFDYKKIELYSFIYERLTWHSAPRTKVTQSKLINNSILNKYKIEIQKMAKNAVRIAMVPIEDDEIKVGSSKIGGLPDLPEDVEYPRWEGKPLDFIAQFNLKEITKYDVDGLLPKTGFLYFFFFLGDEEKQCLCLSPEEKDGSRVIYLDVESEHLKRIEAPESIFAIYPPCMLDFKKEKNIPPHDSLYIDSLHLTFKESDAYHDLELQINGNKMDPTIHKLFGYPNQIQNDMQVDCCLISNGVDLGKYPRVHDPKEEEYKKEYDEWILLLQVDSDDNAGMMWGDMGRLYFWIKKDDLKNRRFEKVWLLWQCF